MFKIGNQLKLTRNRPEIDYKSTRNWVEIELIPARSNQIAPTPKHWPELVELDEWDRHQMNINRHSTKT